MLNQVKGIPCGTKGGVMISFDKIEVVNRLHKEFVYETLLNYAVHYDRTWIYDKIHHEINQFCSAHSLQQVYIDIFDQLCQENGVYVYNLDIIKDDACVLLPSTPEDPVARRECLERIILSILITMRIPAIYVHRSSMIVFCSILYEALPRAKRYPIKIGKQRI